MPEVHRQDDSRSCGATTIVSGQGFVKVDGKLWAVDGDENTDGGGALSATITTIKINGKAIIVNGDPAAADSLCPIPGGPHCAPNASSGDANVKAS